MPITLKAARVNVGLTQQEAAEALNITRATIANYETGRTSPDMVTAQKMATLYKTTVDNLNFSAN